jgi:hypothetical protein
MGASREGAYSGAGPEPASSAQKRLEKSRTGTPSALKCCFVAAFSRTFAMPRYYFHVREGQDVSRDMEGQELPNAEAARSEATSANREILGEKLLHGGSLDSRTIEIADETGHIVDVVSANDVLFKGGKMRSYSDDVTQSAPVANMNSPSK